MDKIIPLRDKTITTITIDASTVELQEAVDQAQLTLNILFNQLMDVLVEAQTAFNNHDAIDENLRR